MYIQMYYINDNFFMGASKFAPIKLLNILTSIIKTIRKKFKLTITCEQHMKKTFIKSNEL